MTATSFAPILPPTMDDVVTIIRTIPLFSELPREILARLVGEMEEVSVPAGRTIVTKGEPGDAMYVVVTGTLEVRGEKEGEEERLAILGPGHWFGEMALLTGDPRSATVATLSESRLLELSKERFLSLSERYPAFLREVARVLCRHVVRVSEDIASARRTSARAFDSILAVCQPDDRHLLLRAAVPERADPAILSGIPGCERAGERLASLRSRYPALLSGGEDGTHELHSSFREYLRERLERDEGETSAAAVHAALAAIYEERGGSREALSHWQQAGKWTEAVRVFRRIQDSSDLVTDEELGRWMKRFPEPVLIENDLIPTKARLLARRGEHDAAIALYRRALSRGPATGAAREALVRGLADAYFRQGAVTQALLCLREYEGGEITAPVALQEAVAARHLAAGRHEEAYAWAQSARAVSRGLQDSFWSPVRRAHIVRGWTGVALALGAAALVLVFPPRGLATPGVHFLAVLLAATVLWARGRPPEYVVALGMGIAWVVLGVAPPQAAFAGFASSTWFLLLGVLGLAAALGRSGLLYRITLLAVQRFPPTFAGQVFALGVAGIFSTLLIPSAQGRMAFTGPMVTGFSDAFQYPPRSRGSAGLALAAFVGFCLTTTLFLSGTPTNLVAWRILPEPIRARVTWSFWLLGVLPLEILTFLGAMAWIIWRYRPEQPALIRGRVVQAQLEALGLPSREERLTIVVAVGLLLGWLTQGLHRVDPAWIALAGLCVLIGTRVLDRAGLQSQVDWPFLLFMGMVVSLGDLAGRVGADAWFARLAQDLLATLGHPVIALGAAVVVTMAVRFVLPWQTAVPLLTVGLLPLAEKSGLSPWLVALVALKAGNVFLVPPQNTYYLTLYYGTEERAFTHAQVRPFAWTYAAIVLVVFLLNLPYWRMLGVAFW